MGEAMLVLFRPIEGDQLYTSAPLATNCTNDPLQSVSDPPTCTVFGNLTSIKTESLERQPLSLLPVTKYVVVVSGRATGPAQLVQESYKAGLHEYVCASLACNTRDFPLHIVVSFV